IFSDTPSNRILQFTFGEPASLYREKSNGANGNALDPQGRLYTCETHSRRVTRTDKKGKIEVLAERWQGKRLNAPNDIVVRKDGNVYFTDPAFGNEADTRDQLQLALRREVIDTVRIHLTRVGLVAKGRIEHIAVTGIA